MITNSWISVVRCPVLFGANLIRLDSIVPKFLWDSSRETLNGFRMSAWIKSSSPLWNLSTKNRPGGPEIWQTKGLLGLFIDFLIPSFKDNTIPEANSSPRENRPWQKDWKYSSKHYFSGGELLEWRDFANLLIQSFLRTIPRVGIDGP